MTIDNRNVWDAFRIPQCTEGAAKPASQHYVIFVDCSEHSLEDVHAALAELDRRKADANG